MSRVVGWLSCGVVMGTPSRAALAVTRIMGVAPNVEAFRVSTPVDRQKDLRLHIAGRLNSLLRQQMHVGLLLAVLAALQQVPVKKPVLAPNGLEMRAVDPVTAVEKPLSGRF